VRELASPQSRSSRRKKKMDASCTRPNNASSCLRRKTKISDSPLFPHPIRAFREIRGPIPFFQIRARKFIREILEPTENQPSTTGKLPGNQWEMPGIPGICHPFPPITFPPATYGFRQIAAISMANYKKPANSTVSLCSCMFRQKNFSPLQPTVPNQICFAGIHRAE
jgi:hypothetical protein